MLYSCIIVLMLGGGNESDDDIADDSDDGDEICDRKHFIFVPDVKYKPVTFSKFGKCMKFVYLINLLS